MSKLAPTSTKYIIKANIKAKGVIEKPDVIGAVFGQTEGLLGSSLDLRELQRTGRIGRIEVNIKSTGGNSEGEILIPSSLDASETALIAATLETIERVGPCTAVIKLDGVEDTRSIKRKYVVDKAKDILKDLIDSGIPDASEVSEQIKEAIRTEEITSFNGLPCGPNMMDSEEIVIVEGRADVLNLLKYGIRNTVALEGTSVPPAIIELAKKKVVTVFVDGDRGGELIIKELTQLTEIDYVTSAPTGKEVEELSKKEVYKALRDKVSPEQFKFETNGMNTANNNYKKETANRETTYKRPASYSQDSKPDTRRRPDRNFDKKYDSRPRTPTKARLTEGNKESFKKTLDELVGSRAAYIFDNDDQLLGKVPVTELENTIKTMDNIKAVVFDGKIDRQLHSTAQRKGVKFLVGMDKMDVGLTSVVVLSRKDL
ncbi:MAG: DNA primase DnaG [Nanoarchaeota archaeon]